MSEIKVVYVMGDRENPATCLAALCAGWHLARGYGVLVASSYPTDQLATMYADPVFHQTGVVVTSVDALVPYHPAAGHGKTQLHRRIALAVRLGGAGLAFNAFPAAEAVVTGDSDCFMHLPPQRVLACVAADGCYSTTLPFARPEAPDGWLNDLGLMLDRKTYHRLLMRGTCPTATTLAVHGMLGSLLLSNIPQWHVSKPLMNGVYQLPGGAQPMLLTAEMEEDAWLNSGAVLWHGVEEAVLSHLCLKTQRSDIPAAEWLEWSLVGLAQQLNVTLGLLDTRECFGREWEGTWCAKMAADEAVLKNAGISLPRQTYGQNWRAIEQAAAHVRTHGSLPAAATSTPYGGITTPLPTRLADLLPALA